MSCKPDNKYSRRSFLGTAALTAAAGTALWLGLPPNLLSASNRSRTAVLIDIERCIGCELCVKACRVRSSHLFPELSSVEETASEKASNKGRREAERDKGYAGRLSAQNWIYIQRLKGFGSKEEELNIPRRCKHCSNPPCAKLCPVSAITITLPGAVVIDHRRCIGCAKCRDVCPWLIPVLLKSEEQGLSASLGRGKMYKCDFCSDRIENRRPPSCVAACPEEVLHWGNIEEILYLAHERKQQEGCFIYGKQDNGGTATIYLSPYPFEKLSGAIKDKYGNPHPSMATNIKNQMESSVEDLYWLLAAAPLAGAAAAAFAAALEKNNTTNSRRGEK